MKPAKFDYESAATVDEAVKLLGGSDGFAKVLAGGQSLGPMMNLRLAQPDLLIDVRRIEELGSVEQRDGGLFIGAGVIHSTIEDGALPDATNGFLPFVAGQIKGCTSQLVTAFQWHKHSQATDAIEMVTVVGVLDRNEGQVVGVLDAGDPSHRDPQSKVIRVVLFGPDLEHLGQGTLADIDNGLVQRGLRGLRRQCAHGVEPIGRASVRRSEPR